MMIARGMLLILLTASLPACNLPRGAALQSEVTSARVQTDATGKKVEGDFDVVDVTRANLARIAAWPATGPANLGWISRQSRPASLVIAGGDKVAVTVWDTDENSLLTSPGQKSVAMQEMTVAGSGDVFLPFVGKIKVSGMTPDAARTRIEKAYAASIPSAQVQLSVTPGRANTANLVAGVDTPGVYPLEDRDVTILALLAMGGGVNPNLTNPQVRLFRDGRPYGISLERLYDDPALDTTLAGGDRVIVEAEDRAFLSLGSAKSQSRHIFPKEGLSALEAMAIMGGVNENRANPKGILILRDYPQQAVHADATVGPSKNRMIFVLDLTTADGVFSAGEFEIMPNDLLYATESPVTGARTIMGLIGSAFGLGVQVERM